MEWINQSGSYIAKKISLLSHATHATGEETITSPLQVNGLGSKYGKSKSPLKVVCFSWLVVFRTCLIHEVLQGKGLEICSRYFLCDQDVEVNSHLYLHCRTTVKPVEYILVYLRGLLGDAKFHP